MNRVIQLDLDDAEPGMVLAEDVRDGRGGMLLPQQTELSEAMLTSLRRRGIDTILVVNDALDEEALRAAREQLERRLERLFRKCADDPAARMLRQSVVDYRSGEHR